MDIKNKTKHSFSINHFFKKQNFSRAYDLNKFEIIHLNDSQYFSKGNYGMSY